MPGRAAAAAQGPTGERGAGRTLRGRELGAGEARQSDEYDSPLTFIAVTEPGDGGDEGDGGDGDQGDQGGEGGEGEG